MSNISSQIRTLQRTRTELLDNMESLNDQAARANRLMTSDEEQAWTRDQARVKELNDNIRALEMQERTAGASARPIELPGGLSSTLGATLAGGRARAKGQFPGQGFTRLIGALALSKGNLPQALAYSERWPDQPEIADVLQTAVKLGSTSDPFWLGRAPTSIGTTTSPTWAAPLVNYKIMADEFIDLLRPVTILGRLSLSPVPFNTKIPRQTAGATAGWVGEGLSKPVSSLAFDTVSIPWAKTSTIVVITQELARFSTPSAELLVRNDLIAAIAAFLDQQFIDPTVAPAVGVRPGSITNGVTPIPSTGSTPAAVMADLSAALLALMTATAGNITTAAWIMSPAAAMFLATLRTAQDVFLFPGMTSATIGANGLSLLGLPVVVSGNVAVDGGGKSSIILVEQKEILLADDGETLIDASAEASVQMDSAPATPPTPLVSFWQQNLLGIKAERYIYWLRRRAGVVQVITGFPASP